MCMADLDDFNFDDIESSDQNDPFDEAFSSSETASGSEFGSFEDQSQVQTADGNVGNKGVIKQAAIIIAVGLIFIILAFTIVKWVKNGQSTSSNNKTTIVNENKDIQSDGGAENSTTNTDEWIEVDGSSNITFNDEYINSVFTVTSISHSVKVVDSEKNLMIKTTLVGTLDGIRGTYELEIPYSKGIQLKVGNYFSVEVQLGNYNGKKVVGEIRY